MDLWSWEIPQQSKTCNYFLGMHEREVLTVVIELLRSTSHSGRLFLPGSVELLGV